MFDRMRRPIERRLDEAFSGWLNELEADRNIRAQMARTDRHGTERLLVVLRRCALQDAPDDLVRRELQRKLDAGEVGLIGSVDCMTILLRQPANYLDDRAWRLLGGATGRRPPSPPKARYEALFRAERKLGRMPVKQAFATLARRSSALAELPHRLAANRAHVDDPLAASAMVKTELQSVVGLEAQSDDEILRSDLAKRIAHDFLLVGLGYLGSEYRCSRAFDEATEPTSPVSALDEMRTAQDLLAVILPMTEHGPSVDVT